MTPGGAGAHPEDILGKEGIFIQPVAEQIHSHSHSRNHAKQKHCIPPEGKLHILAQHHIEKGDHDKGDILFFKHHDQIKGQKEKNAGLTGLALEEVYKLGAQDSHTEYHQTLLACNGGPYIEGWRIAKQDKSQIAFRGAFGSQQEPAYAYIGDGRADTEGKHLEMEHSMEGAYYKDPQMILHEKELPAKLLQYHGEGAVFFMRKPVAEGPHIPQDGEPGNDKLGKESHQYAVKEETCYKQ